MLTLYRCLLSLYPADHRNRFGQEMVAVFQDIHAEAIAKNMIARGIFCLRETTGLVAGALQEHLRALGATPAWLPIRNRRLFMRSEFRFPKATAVLMTIILAGVVLAINKGEGIVASLNASPHFNLLPSVMLILALVYAAGAIGWAILFAMGRSGVHRLEASSSQK
jgi:hypothetical protein